MSTQQVTFFKSRDVRGELGLNFDRLRCTREITIDCCSCGAWDTDAGANVLDLGRSGTKGMYWLATKFGA
jgi:hypothetical protein